MAKDSARPRPTSNWTRPEESVIGVPATMLPEAILPLGIALGCEIEQRPAETPEVARAVIHREIHRSVGRALRRRRLAIQVARAVGLEAERNIIEETVDARVVDEQAIARKISG